MASSAAFADPEHNVLGLSVPPFSEAFDHFEFTALGRRVEQAFAHLNADVPTNTSKEELVEAKASIPNYANGLVNALRIDFGMRGRTSALIKKELDDVVAAAVEKFNIHESNRFGTIQGAQDKFNGTEVNFQELHKTTVASEQHFRAQLGQFVGKLSTSLLPAASPATHADPMQQAGADAWAASAAAALIGSPQVCPYPGAPPRVREKDS